MLFEEPGGASRVKILVVDDEAYPHVKIAEELASLTFPTKVEVVSARSVAEAKDLIGQRFFHLAFVDMHIQGQPGIGVVRILASCAPSCRIAIMTQFLETYAPDVLQVLDGSIRFEGLINKVSGPSIWFRPMVVRIEKELSERGVDLEGLAPLVESIREKRRRIDKILDQAGELVRLRVSSEEVAAEVDYLFTNLFGTIGSATPTSRARMSLRAMPRGFSSSVVVEVSPSIHVEGISGPVLGNRCVVKVGPKPEILREVERYERIVRYGVTLEHRVELLGVMSGDALAAICYSFVGGNSSDIQSLEDVLVRRDSDLACQVVDRLFAPSVRNWYAVQARTACLRDFFTADLGAPLEKAYDSLEIWLNSLRDKIAGLRLEGGRLVFEDGMKLIVPDRGILASGGVLSEVPGSLVHGDMHGGNVLVSRSGSRVCLIDFSNAGLGPRLLDFASLQATVRLAHSRALAASEGWEGKPTSTGVAQIARFSRLEEGLAGSRLTSSGEWWAKVAIHLKAALVANFPDAESSEVLWTELAYCLSMFRFQRLEWYEKLRLLVWLSAIVGELRQEGAWG